MLNRAPTLHRLQIRYFELTLIEGKAIGCIRSFVRRSMPTSTVTRWLFTYSLSLKPRWKLTPTLASNNVLVASQRRADYVPSQDIVLVCITRRDQCEGRRMYFADVAEIERAMSVVSSNPCPYSIRLKQYEPAAVEGEWVRSWSCRDDRWSCIAVAYLAERLAFQGH